MTAVTETPSQHDGAPERTSTFSAFVALGKLRLSSLAIFAVVAGIYLGATGDVSSTLLVGTTIGTLLVAVAGNAFNMLIERKFDEQMNRTKDRPLPSGSLTPLQVMGFGSVCVLAGVVILAMTTNWLATFLCAMIFVSYVGIYTPLKRKTTLNTLIGAIPGALPPVVGYAAAKGELDTNAALLFGILFFWQIPHFLAISWRHREDYRRGGMKMLAVYDEDGRATARQMLVYTSALTIVALMPFKTELAGQAYLGTAVVLNFMFFVPVAIAAFVRSETAMKQAFLMSLAYLPILLGMMVLDRIRPDSFL